MARQWMKFFLDAGIPKESSAEYAVNFEENRMEMDMLAELDKDYLRYLFCYLHVIDNKTIIFILIAGILTSLPWVTSSAFSDMPENC